MEKKKQEKKIYSKPLLEVIDLDHEISLVMMTDPPETGGNFPSSASSGINQQEPVQLSSTSEDNDPFGGSSPQY